MAAASSSSRYQGDFVAWRGGCALLGMGAADASIETHSHYAIQLVVGAPSGLQVQFGRRGAFQSCAAAIIPSGAPHTIDVRQCQWAAVLLIEPDTAEGKALTSLLEGRMRVLEPQSVLPMAERLAQAWLSEKDADQVKAVCMELVRDLAQASSREPSDPRVLAAIEYIQARVDRQVTLDEVAAVARLSPSRFRHLFVADTGMPLRTYMLWRRLLHVRTLLMQGETLSRAAHAAGFADSAHLSRTSRSMFGLPPSAMQLSGPLSANLHVAQRYLG